MTSLTSNNKEYGMTENTITNDVDQMLTNVATMTEEIRELQLKIKERGVERRKIIVDLRNRNVTYRSIAQNMGVTEQNVYKILHRPTV